MHRHQIRETSGLHDYQLAFSLAPLPMLLVSADGDIVLANGPFGQLFQYQEDELIGQKVDALIPPRFRLHHASLASAYFDAPTRRTMKPGRDLVGLTRNGQEVPVELLLEAIDIRGQAHVLLIALDLTERKRHEKTMTLAMNAAASAMLMVGDSGEIRFSNKAAVELFGYSADELNNQTIDLLVPSRQRQVHKQYRNEFLSNKQARPMANTLDVYALHRNGHEIPVTVSLTPIETPQGSMVVGTILDLSERKTAQRDMADKNAQLEIVNSELSQFAFSASHDLKAPLSSIDGLASVCLEDLDDGNLDELRKNLDRIQRIASHSTEKVEGVLKIARAGRERIVPEVVDFKNLVDDIWLDLTGVQHTNLQLKLDLGHSEPVFLERLTCKVILENLLSNAIRYRDVGKPNTVIEFRSRSNKDMLELAISDNGIGISAKYHHKIYDMFQRLHKNSGDGLGLALVKKHVDRLGGQIQLVSAEGEGSEFTVRLPIEKAGDS